jgi:hypothetical protein|eukprot:scaffold3521_cov195-Alexandrium_tamarense.AAC.20
MKVNVHFLELATVGSEQNLNVLWHLVDIQSPPQLSQSALPQGWAILEGDLVVFPSLASGAGEMEMVRFVGPKTSHVSEKGDEDALPLLAAGVEYPQFPQLIVSLAEERGVSLREMYEAPLDLVLRTQPPNLGLRDLYSNDDEAYEGFWQNPPVARRRGPSGDPWRISLKDCVWKQTVELPTAKGDEL